MDPPTQFVVMTGVPGCGKSTLGRSLAERLGLAYLDKDEILESLFDGLGCADGATRQHLSRVADLVFERIARALPGAVLDSFWRHPDSDASSGTPSQWLIDPSYRVLEVFCSCRSEIAATRFLDRARHPGHHDSAWTHEALVAQSSYLLSTLPLGLGLTVEIETSRPYDMESIAKRVASALEV